MQKQPELDKNDNSFVHEDEDAKDNIVKVQNPPAPTHPEVPQVQEPCPTEDIPIPHLYQEESSSDVTFTNNPLFKTAISETYISEGQDVKAVDEGYVGQEILGELKQEGLLGQNDQNENVVKEQLSEMSFTSSEGPDEDVQNPNPDKTATYTPLPTPIQHPSNLSAEPPLTFTFQNTSTTGGI